MNITIGEKIKDLRKFHSITQNALASYLGVSSQSISKWENGISMPDISIIPHIASYFGITIDELFNFTPNKSREMQIEMYFQALYHLMEMATCTRLEGILALTPYIKQNEINPLMYEGAVMLCDGIGEEIVSLYLKTKGKNEYTNFDENYVDCIVTGIKNIQNGQRQNIIQLLALVYVPKNINKEVSDKFYEVCKVNVEENRKMFCTQTIKSEKTNLLEFIANLSDDVIQKILLQLDSKISYMLFPAMFGASGEVNKRIMKNIISENEHEILYNVLHRERYLNNYGESTKMSMPIYYDWIYHFIYSRLYKQRYTEDFICQAQQKILDIYNLCGE